MYFMCTVSNQSAFTNTIVKNRILCDSLLGTKLYSNCRGFSTMLSLYIRFHY